MWDFGFILGLFWVFACLIEALCCIIDEFWVFLGGFPGIFVVFWVIGGLGFGCWFWMPVALCLELRVGFCGFSLMVLVVLGFDTCSLGLDLIDCVVLIDAYCLDYG